MAPLRLGWQRAYGLDYLVRVPLQLLPLGQIAMTAGNPEYKRPKLTKVSLYVTVFILYRKEIS
jgi:hypothetical protein